MKNPLIYLFWLIVLGGILNYFLTSSAITDRAKKEMAEADAAYKRGEVAPTIGERQEAFNEALKHYTHLEEEYHPLFSTGVLYADIANAYFQVEQYPYAALYYYRALKLRPLDQMVAHNLAIINEKLGLHREKPSAFSKIFFFYTFLSLPEKLQLFFAFSIIALLTSSIYIWQGKNWMKNSALVSIILAGIMLAAIGYTHFFAPIEGVIIHSTDLYRDAGFQYVKASREPVLSGKKVEVVDVLKDGKWLKIMTGKELGYVPAESIRII